MTYFLLIRSFFEDNKKKKVKALLKCLNRKFIGKTAHGRHLVSNLTFPLLIPKKTSDCRKSVQL